MCARAGSPNHNHFDRKRHARPKCRIVASISFRSVLVKHNTYFTSQSNRTLYSFSGSFPPSSASCLLSNIRHPTVHQFLSTRLCVWVGDAGGKRLRSLSHGVWRVIKKTLFRALTYFVTFICKFIHCSM